MFFAIITLVIGLCISATAGYFSIIGLGQLFAAGFWSAIVMGTVIEAGKIMAATWLHANWHNPLVSKLHKGYLILAIIVCMLITSLGIFSQLSKAHLDQEAPVIEQLTSQNALEDQIKSLNDDLTSLQKNLNDINSLSNKDNNRSLDAQRSRILKQMDKDRLQIQQLNTELLKDKKETSKVTLQLGPAKYLADLLFGNGDRNIDKAVQIFILLIMSVFDPLAIMLILSANISFRNLKKKDEVKSEIKIQEIQPSVSEKIELPKKESHVFYDPILRWFTK